MSKDNVNANLLTPAQLAEIAERVDRAPYGPLVSEPAVIQAIYKTPCYGVYKKEYASYAFAYAETKESADFIANAPEDIKRLLAHIEALRAENGRMNIAIKESNCNRCGCHISSRHANPTGKYMATATGIYCGDCEPYEEENE